MINQCDGCRAGMALTGGMHRDEGGHAVMTCQASRYGFTKVIFLDIDGVLNCHRTAFGLGGIPHEFTPEGVAQLDAVAIGLIRSIAATAGAGLVLSSTWRLHHTAEEAAQGLGLPIFDCTPRFAGIRGDEIQDWLNRHPEVTDYAIVDDDRDMLPEQMHRLVHTSGFDGFSWANAMRLSQLMGIDIFDVISHRGASQQQPDESSKKV